MTRRRIALIASTGATLIAVVIGNFVLADAVYNDLPAPLYAQMEPIAGSLASSHCGECHQGIHRDWIASAHGRAHLNPLYLADFRHQDKPYPCEYCHTPLVAQRPEIVTGIWMVWPWLIPRAHDNPDYQEALRSDGVGCVVCHQRDGAMIGPFDAVSTAGHPTRKQAMGVETCRPCHALDLTVGADLARPIQDTFGEWDEYRAKGGQKTCIDCHMPRTAPEPVATGGPPRLGRDHRLKGPRDIAFLRSGVQIQAAAFDPATGTATITVFNGTGHRLPTAEPQRRVENRLTSYDGSGQVVDSSAQNIQRVILLPRLVEVSDNTLLPREKRTIRLKVATESAREVRAHIDFHLWDPDHVAARAARIRPSDLKLGVWTQTWRLSAP